MDFWERRIFRNMKIRWKLVISYFVVCVIPLLMISTVIYQVSARMLEETALEFASVFSSQIVFSLNDFMDEYDSLTKLALMDSEMIENLDNTETSISHLVNQQLYIRRCMMRLYALQSDIQDILFWSTNEKIYHFNPTGTSESIDREILEQQEWFRKMEQSRDTLMISAIHDRNYYDKNQDEMVLTVGRKILNYRGAYMGILLMDLKPSSLIKLNDEFLLARNQYNIKISITDNENEILYDSDIASGQMTWKEARENENYLLFHKDSEDYITFTDEAKKAGVNVNVIIPKSTLLLKIYNIEYVTLFSIMICVLLIILVSILLSRGIINPLRNLQMQMEQMENGNYEVMAVRRSNDEVGSLVNSYNHMVMKIKSLIEEVYVAEIKQKNAKYLALQTQINPHMLYNTLESIRLKALMSGADEVADMIKILAKMFRVALSSRTASHQIRDELEYAVNYIKLQNMRFPEMFSLNVEMEEELYDAAIISMVLQPLIENSIEHGFKGQGIPLHIVLNGFRDGQRNIYLRISDDGKGMSWERMDEIIREIQFLEKTKLEQSQDGSSIGIKNIAERIKLHYGDAFYLKILNSSENGTTIEICIPG